MTQEAASSSPGGARPHAAHGDVRTLALAALGVVFGDIGTSPLYALKECVNGEHGVSPTPENILGLLSLIFWSITLVVSIKYVTFITRADNGGEGGILALLALVPADKSPGASAKVGWVAAFVVFGAALLYGDGIITPAISVLSAVEGIAVVTTSLKPAVVPITCGILVGLFWIQKRGTAGIGKVFGPVMVLWFLTLGALGSFYIVKYPGVLWALSPHHAVLFFADHHFHGIVVLGAVVLSITGGEALYADMGHFGRPAIRMAWYGLAMPALVLNYLGQGALILIDPTAAKSPFYSMVPNGIFTYLLVALAAAATVIASQALISGAFSLTRQAVQLGFMPRATVKHTSSETEGQIYIPEVNWAIAISCLTLVLVFKESTRLAAAYGIAVTGTMGVTSMVYFVVLRKTWRWPLARAAPLVGVFLLVDLAFFASNLLKFFDGGYVPILIAAALFVCMLTWRRGRRFLSMAVGAKALALDEFIANLDETCKARVPGTAVFLWSRRETTPPTLKHHLKHNKVLHETVVIFTIETLRVPRVGAGERLEVIPLRRGFYRVVAHSGFMESPNVPALLRLAERAGLPVDHTDTTYYVGRETFLATEKGRMGSWSESLFAFMSRNAPPATAYFNLPPERVVEIGMQLDL